MEGIMKEVEKKFFRFCMKHLKHINTEYNKNIGMHFRDGYLMWTCMNDFCEKYDVPFKVIEAITWKWDDKGLFTWDGDMWGTFHPEKFPLEYVMIVPPRTIIKCGFLYSDNIKLIYAVSHGLSMVKAMQTTAEKCDIILNKEIEVYNAELLTNAQNNRI